MELNDWTDLQDHVMTVYAQGRPREALEAADRAARVFPDMSTRTAYWRACLHSLLGETREALAILREGVGHGIWWSESTLMNESDFAPIRDFLEFQDILRVCKDMAAAAQRASRPQLMILPPRKVESPTSPPLLMALHSRGANSRQFAPRWEAAVDAGMVVAVPQSSQMCATDEYCWDDEDKAAGEVAWAYARASEECRFDADRVVLAGASQGARIAIAAALKGGGFRSCGFIAVVPAIRDITQLAALMPEAVRRYVRGYIVTGDKDQFYQWVCLLHDAMKNAGLSCELDVREGMGHRFPPDFGTTLPRALDFVLARE
jgi:predicted esterase